MEQMVAAGYWRCGGCSSLVPGIAKCLKCGHPRPAADVRVVGGDRNGGAAAGDAASVGKVEVNGVTYPILTAPTYAATVKTHTGTLGRPAAAEQKPRDVTGRMEFTGAQSFASPALAAYAAKWCSGPGCLKAVVEGTDRCVACAERPRGWPPPTGLTPEQQNVAASQRHFEAPGSPYSAEFQRCWSCCGEMTGTYLCRECLTAAEKKPRSLAEAGEAERDRRLVAEASAAWERCLRDALPGPREWLGSGLATAGAAELNRRFVEEKMLRHRQRAEVFERHPRTPFWMYDVDNVLSGRTPSARWDADYRAAMARGNDTPPDTPPGLAVEVGVETVAQAQELALGFASLATGDGEAARLHFESAALHAQAAKAYRQEAEVLGPTATAALESTPSAVEAAPGRTIEAFTRPLLYVDDMHEPP